MVSETPLGQVRGLGSAHHGGHHWVQERMVSVATLLLLMWLGISLWRLPALDHKTLTEWLSQPIAAVPMLLFILAAFWHLMMGLRVVIDDYVHEEGSRFFWNMVASFFAIGAGATAAFYVLKIALTVTKVAAVAPGAAG